MEFGSLFAGIGGFDLGFERSGMKCKWQVEIDEYCLEILRREWADVPKFGDVRDYESYNFTPVDLICGGDPCPVRSVARGSRKSNHPDLAGYFLALVGRLQPQWVVRENVLAPDGVHFAAGLELLRYGIIAVAIDARDFTSQSRRRQFIIGCPPDERARFQRTLFNATDDVGPISPRFFEESPVTACLTAHPNRVAPEDTYCYEEGRGLRILDSTEAERLQGFPVGWTEGFSRSRRRIMIGNAVVPAIAEFLGRSIMESQYD